MCKTPNDEQIEVTAVIFFIFYLFLLVIAGVPIVDLPRFRNSSNSNDDSSIIIISPPVSFFPLQFYIYLILSSFVSSEFLASSNTYNFLIVILLSICLSIPFLICLLMLLSDRIIPSLFCIAVLIYFDVNVASFEII